MSAATVALAVWTLAVAAVSLRAAWAGFGARAAPTPSPVDPSLGDVFVVRPCAGREPRLADTLGSTRALPTGVPVVFAVAREDDPEIGRAHV